MRLMGGMAPARRRLALVLASVLLVAILATGALLGFRALADRVDPVAQDRPGPVLLVPGYGGSTTALDGLAGVLRAEGRDATVVALAGDGTGDLREQAQVLADAADAALARTGAISVDVVGYSAGGVVTRLWLRELDGAAQARRVITLGSPHHGTTVAGLAESVVPDQCPEACRQLVPDSDLLRSLNAGDETPDGPAYVSIWTAQDETVTPPDSARLEGAVNLVLQDICAEAVVAHGELPTDPLVQAIVAVQLSAGPVTDLGPGDCARLS